MTNEQLVAEIKAGVNKKDNMLQLWQQNKRFVSMIAQKYIGYAERDDLEQEGSLALCCAVNGYDEGLGVPFINYAANWLHQGMRRYIDNCGSIVRIPVHEQQKQKEYKKAINAFKMCFGRQPTQVEAAEYMGLTLMQLETIAKSLHMKEIGSLDVPIDGEDGECTIGAMVAGVVNVEEDVLDHIEQEELKKVLWDVVDTLPGKQPQVLRMRYQQGKSLNEIGLVLNTSYQNVHELQYKAFREMRKSQTTRKLEPFLADYIGSKAYNSNGAGVFAHTLTSSTESVAMQLYEKWMKEEKHEGF